MKFFNLLNFFVITCFLLNVAFPTKSVFPREQDYESAQNLLDNLSERKLEQNTDKDNIINLLAHVKTQILLTFFVAMHLSFDGESPGYFTMDPFENTRDNCAFHRPIYQIIYMLDYVERVINYVSTVINNGGSCKDVAGFCIFPLHSASIILSIPCTSVVLQENHLSAIRQLQNEETYYIIDKLSNLFSFEVDGLKIYLANSLLEINMKYLVDLVSFLKNEHYIKKEIWIKMKNLLDSCPVCSGEDQLRIFIEEKNLKEFLWEYLRKNDQEKWIKVERLQVLLENHCKYPEKRFLWANAITSSDYLHSYSKNNIYRFLAAKNWFNLSAIPEESLRFLNIHILFANKINMDFVQCYRILYSVEREAIEKRFESLSRHGHLKRRHSF